MSKFIMRKVIKIIWTCHEKAEARERDSHWKKSKEREGEYDRLKTPNGLTRLQS